MSDAPCDVGPVEIEIWGGSHDAPKRHHPAGIEPPELYEQWRETLVESIEYQSAEPPRRFAHYAVVDLPQRTDREIERARERDLIARCPDVASYTQACRYMHAEPAKPQPDPFAAEGAVFARLIENNR